MRFLIIIAVLTISISTVTSQTDTPTPTHTPQPFNQNSDCGSGLPCGQLPWNLPSFPVLESPTPLDILDSSINPGDTPTPTPDYLGQVTQAIGFAEDLNLTGTPFDFQVTEEAEYEDIITNSTLFFSYFKSLATVDFGVLTPLLLTFFTLISLTFLIKVSTFIVPIIGVFAGLIRKIIELIPGF